MFPPAWPGAQHIYKYPAPSFEMHCPDLRDLALKIAMATDTTAGYRSEVWVRHDPPRRQTLSSLYIR